MTQIHWLNAVSDSFTNASDWSGGVVPGASDAAILDAAGITPYTVSSSTNETVNSIQTAANATLAVTYANYTMPTNFTATNGTGGGANAGVISVSNGATLTLGGTVDNAGSIVVSGGFRGTRLAFAGAGATLTGGGVVTFTANSGDNFSGAGRGALTNVDNTISGDFNFLSLTELVNDSAGVIDAINTLSGSTSEAEISAGTITNAGLIESTGPNPLFLFAYTLNNSGGVIFAGDGSVIEIIGGRPPVTLVGGTLKTSGTGVILADGVVLDGTTVAVNNQGVVDISHPNNNPRIAPSLSLEGTINNTGTITLNSGGELADLTIGQSNAVLTGGGAIVLNNTGRNIVTGASSTATLTNVDNTISGAGQVGRGTLGLINEAAGVINGNDTSVLTLNTGANTVVNDGLIEGTGTGGLVIQASKVVNDGLIQGTGTGGLTIRTSSVDGSGGGVIFAGNGSHVGLQGAGLIGGTLKSSGNGQIKTYRGGSNLLDGTAFAVSNQALVVVQNSTALTIQGAIVNANRIALNSTGSATTLTIGAAGATLSGGGSVNLTNSALNSITGASSAATLTNVDNTINGAGQIGAGSMTLINNAKGAIVGSQATGLTLDTGTNTIVNAGLILSRGAGGVTIQSAVANSGLLEADGGVLTVNGAVSGTGAGVITGGTLDFASSFSEKVVFTGATGVLELAQSQSYAGTVFGFSKTGGTSLDLRDIAFVGSSEATFSGTASGGVLTVTDGTHIAHLTLRGDYRASTFTASSDGHGGTIVVDPAAASTTTAHRFIAAAAGLIGSASEAIHVGTALVSHAPMLARPHTMVA